MPNYYSPSGNIEVWDKKPAGYFTEKEWNKLHPVEVPEDYEVPAPPTDEELAAQVRMERDAKLIASDKYLLPDWPGMTEELNAKVLEYRKALRDVTKQSGFPSKVEWPVNPMEA